MHTSGVQGNQESGCDDGSFPVRCLAFSAHGRYLAFPSYATNLIDDHRYTYQNLFLRDRRNNQTLLLSREYFFDTWGEPGDDDSTTPAMSPSGRFIAFASKAWLAGDDLPGTWDIFVYDQGEGVRDMVMIFLPVILRQ